MFILFSICLIIFGFFLSITAPFYDYKIKNIQYPYDKLLIVAHPDDECLWAFKHLKNQKGWKVICVTNAKNSTRKQEFINVMNYFKCNYEMWNYFDADYCYNWSNHIYQDLDEVINQDENIKKVYTHNPNGEYGHIQHIKVNNVVLDVSQKPTYVFQYSNENNNNNLEKKNFKFYKSQQYYWDYYAKKNINEKMKRLL